MAVVVAIAAVAAFVVPASALTGTASWQNLAFAPQAGTFTAYFAAVPLAAGIDGVVGLAAAPATSYDSCAVLVRFNTSGTIDAINGAGYSAAAAIPYISGKTYRFRLVVNVATHTYSVYVTPPGAAETLLGGNYAFRTSQSTVTSLGNWAVVASSGQHIVGSFSITGSTPPPTTTTPPPTTPTALTAEAGPTLNVSPGGSATLAGAASGGTAPYTYTWSPATGLSSTTVAAPTAAPTATTTYTLTVRDAAGAAATDTTTVTVAVPIGGTGGTPPPPTNTGGWTPPIGIPMPPFGIAESHQMYKGKTYNFNGSVKPYNDAGYGPYTHYIDNTKANATDTNNPFGTAALPRRTIPKNLSAGSVVEIHGGPYPGGETIVVPQGTAAQPIFIRGINKPRFVGRLTVFSNTGIESKYTIFEGLSVYKFWTIAPTSYLCYRYNEVAGDMNNGGMAIDSFNSIYSNHHDVFYKNVVRDNGNWLAEFDQDVHGIHVARYTNNLWILDNEIYHSSGDGLQINASNMNLAPHTHHIYVGRNNVHHNKQAGIWSKQATDVIFSQNTVHDHKPIGAKPSAWGTGMGFQYAPERIWFLYNHVYNCAFGISTGSSDGVGNGLNSYFIGNVIHDIHHDPAYQYNYRPSSGYSEAGMTFTNSGNKYVINNTIYNCDAGINTAAGGPLLMVNNIIANVTEAQGNHVLHEGAAGASVSDLNNCLLYQANGSVRIRWAGTAAQPFATFQTKYNKGAGCQIGNPLFVNPAASDFRLQQASPAVNRGIASNVYQTFYSLYGLNISVDYAGAARPKGGAMDIGACESY